jgi:hypothetical protein
MRGLKEGMPMKAGTLIALGAILILGGVILVTAYKMGEEANRTVFVIAVSGLFSALGIIVGYGLGRSSAKAWNDQLPKSPAPVTQMPQPMIINIPQPNMQRSPIYEIPLGANSIQTALDDGDTPLTWNIK